MRSPAPETRAYASAGAYDLPSDATRCTRDAVGAPADPSMTLTFSTPVGRFQRRDVIVTVR